VSESSSLTSHTQDECSPLPSAPLADNDSAKQVVASNGTENLRPLVTAAKNSGMWDYGKVG